MQKVLHIEYQEKPKKNIRKIENFLY